MNEELKLLWICKKKVGGSGRGVSRGWGEGVGGKGIG